MRLSYSTLSHLSTLKITPVDLSRYIQKQKGFEEDCKLVSDSLHRYGVCVVKDPRCKNQEKQNFLDLMERYFQDRSLKRDQGKENVDSGPENSFTGLSYDGKETFNSYSKQKAKFLPPNNSVTPDEPVPDPTWRYRWFVDGDKNIIPSDFKNWEETMNLWGRKKMNCCQTFAQMAALGFGIEKDFFLNSIKNGFGHLSPTGLDLTKMKVGQVMTAFHYDYDLITIHGKPRFGGLFIWLNTGEKVRVLVPDGHLLIQAGKQFEWLTGGYVKAGWHQVVFTEEVRKQRDEAIQKGKIPWRVSSVLFYQIDGSYIMKPHPKFTDETSSKLYPPTKADDYMSKQLYILTGEKW